MRHSARGRQGIRLVKYGGKRRNRVSSLICDRSQSRGAFPRAGRSRIASQRGPIARAGARTRQRRRGAGDSAQARRMARSDVHPRDDERTSPRRSRPESIRSNRVSAPGQIEITSRIFQLFIWSRRSYDSARGVRMKRQYLVALSFLLAAGFSACAGRGISEAPVSYMNPEGSRVEALAMTSPRANAAAIRLRDGRVLICGGTATGEVGGVLSSAELYDPAAHSFTPT